jgi:hypothetical protein
VIQDLSAGPVVGELLQRQGSSGNVLRQGLSGMVVVAFEAYGIVHGESRVPPAQEGSGELKFSAFLFFPVILCVAFALTSCPKPMQSASSPAATTGGITGHA